MELLTCTCKHCRYVIQRQKKHGVSMLVLETRSIRRIVKQILKSAHTHNVREFDIPSKRHLKAQA